MRTLPITDTLLIISSCFQVPKLVLVQEPILDDALKLSSFHSPLWESKSFSVLPGQQAVAAGGNGFNHEVHYQNLNDQSNVPT